MKKVESISAMKFNLRNPKMEVTTINVIVRENGERLTYPLHNERGAVRVKSSHWHKSTYSAVTTGRLTEVDRRNNEEVNRTISSYLEEYDRIISYLCEHPDKTFKELFMVKTKKEEKDLFTTLEELINTPNVTNDARKLLQTITRFSPCLKGKRISEVGRVWFNALIEFGKGLDIAKDTLKADIRRIKRLVNILFAKGIITDGALMEVERIKPTFIQGEAITSKFFLYDEEVIAISKVEFGRLEPKRLGMVRDLFMFECTTGIRFSDFKNIRLSNEGGVWVVNLIQEKTNKAVKCEVVFKLAVEIWEKYKGNLTPVSATQYNKDLKKIGRLAGLNREIEFTDVRANGEVIKKRDKICNLLSSHIGRHTFDSLLKMRGWEESKIANYSGHTAQEVRGYTERVANSDLYRFRKSTIRLEEFDYSEEKKEVVTTAPAVTNTTSVTDTYKRVREKLINAINPTKEELEVVAKGIKGGELKLDKEENLVVWEIGYRLLDEELIQCFQMGAGLEVMSNYRIGADFSSRESMEEEGIIIELNLVDGKIVVNSHPYNQ